MPIGFDHGSITPGDDMRPNSVAQRVPAVPSSLLCVLAALLVATAAPPMAMSAQANLDAGERAAAMAKLEQHLGSRGEGSAFHDSTRSMPLEERSTMESPKLARCPATSTRARAPGSLRGSRGGPGRSRC